MAHDPAVHHYTTFQVWTQQLKCALAPVPDPNAVLALAMPTKEENISLHNFLCLFMMHIFMMDMKSQISTSRSGNESTYTISATYVEK